MRTNGYCLPSDAETEKQRGAGPTGPTEPTASSLTLEFGGKSLWEPSSASFVFKLSNFIEHIFILIFEASCEDPPLCSKGGKTHNFLCLGTVITDRAPHS